MTLCAEQEKSNLLKMLDIKTQNIILRNKRDEMFASDNTIHFIVKEFKLLETTVKELHKVFSERFFEAEIKDFNLELTGSDSYELGELEDFYATIKCVNRKPADLEAPSITFTFLRRLNTKKRYLDDFLAEVNFELSVDNTLNYKWQHEDNFYSTHELIIKFFEWFLTKDLENIFGVPYQI